MKKMFLAILAILVVAGLSFGAWQYLQKEDQKPAQNNQTANDPSEGGKYLVIKEWNVRVPYSVLGSKDTHYRILDSSRLYFYLNGLQEKVNQLSASDKQVFDECIQYPTRVIVRVNNIDAANSPFESYIKHPLKSIDGFGYVIPPPQAICPQQESSPTSTRLIDEYVLAPFKERRASIIDSLEPTTSE